MRQYCRNRQDLVFRLSPGHLFFGLNFPFCPQVYRRKCRGKTGTMAKGKGTFSFYFGIWHNKIWHPEWIRTTVNAFAEHYLASRSRGDKIQQFSNLPIGPFHKNRMSPNKSKRGNNGQLLPLEHQLKTQTQKHCPVTN